VAELINRALQEKPDNASAWSVHLRAEAQGVSKSTVQRWFSLFEVKPYLSDSFKLFSDPLFIEKVRDVTGLYLNPSDNATVLCVDEKSQIQALNRTRPALPPGLDSVPRWVARYRKTGRVAPGQGRRPPSVAAGGAPGPGSRSDRQDAASDHSPASGASGSRRHCGVPGRDLAVFEARGSEF